MVQLTYLEMNCIKGGIGITAAPVNIIPPVDIIIPEPYQLAAAPTDDKRKPRPGGGVSTS